MTYLFLDSSGDRRFIAAVVCDFLPSLDFTPHIASYSRQDRIRILEDVLNFINDRCYGLCLEANLRAVARSIISARNNRRSAWRIAMTIGLRRILDHLRSKNIKNFSSVLLITNLAILLMRYRRSLERAMLLLGRVST